MEPEKVYDLISGVKDDVGKLSANVANLCARVDGLNDTVKATKDTVNTLWGHHDNLKETVEETKTKVAIIEDVEAKRVWTIRAMVLALFGVVAKILYDLIGGSRV